MPAVDPVVLQLRADTNQYTSAVRQAGVEVQRSLAQQDKAVVDLERRMQASTSAIGSSLKTLAGTIAAGFSVREIVSMADTFTRVGNQLRVAGLEGANLELVQNRLFESARRYGTEIETLSQLYGRTIQVADDLGATQEDMLRFTEGVAAAVAVQGGAASQASGAIMQLTQALGSGVVRAEEFNSINEGAIPILQAVARNMDGMGGSVARLRRAVIDGQVSSQEFFKAFLAGTDELQTQAATSVKTTSQAFTILRNELVKYIGEAGLASGATAALSQAIISLSNNLGVIIPALAAIGVALGAGFVTRMGAAAIAARGVGGAIMGAFGGPVGIAITGVTLALASFGVEAVKTQNIVASMANSLTTARNELEIAQTRGDKASATVKGVGDDAASSTPKITAFAGEVGKAADALYRLAQARQQDELSRLEESRRQASRRAADLMRQTDAGIQSRLSPTGDRPQGLAGLADFGAAVGTRLGRVTGLWGPASEEVDAALKQAQEELRTYDAAISEVSGSLERFGKEIRQEQAAASRGASSSAKDAIKKTADATKAAGQTIRPEIDAWTVELERMQAAAERSAEVMASLNPSQDIGPWASRQGPAQQNPWDEAWQSMEATARRESELLDELAREQQRNLRDLAGVYYDLFSGQTDNIWDNFKRIALMRLSEIAADRTIGLIGNLFGNVGGSILSGIFGRASGGYVAPNSITRVNENRGGVELLRMGSQGAQVIPLGRANVASTRQQPVAITVQVEEGALFRPVVREESSRVAVPIAANMASQAASAMGQAVLGQMPARMARWQRDGT